MPRLRHAARSRHLAALAPIIVVLLLAGCGGTQASPAASVAVANAAPSAAAVAPTSAPSVPSGTPAVASQPQTIHVLEDPIEFSDVKVGSLTGCSTTDCQGDTLIGRSRMLDATTRKDVGTFLVNCFLVDPARACTAAPPIRSR